MLIRKAELSLVLDLASSFPLIAHERVKVLLCTDKSLRRLCGVIVSSFWRLCEFYSCDFWLDEAIIVFWLLPMD